MKIILKDLLFECVIDDIPIAKANSYRKSKRSFYLKKKDKQNIEYFIHQLTIEYEKQKLKTIDYPCVLCVEFTLPDKRRRDMDNMLKTLQDCIEKANVVKDDNLFQLTITEKNIERKNKKTAVRIYRTAETIL